MTRKPKPMADEQLMADEQRLLLKEPTFVVLPDSSFFDEVDVAFSAAWVPVDQIRLTPTQWDRDRSYMPVYLNILRRKPAPASPDPAKGS